MTAEAKAQARRRYDRTRDQSPERKEYHRRYARAKNEKAKAISLCVGYASPPIPGQTRCPT